jgi:hypothetical protein
MKSVSDARSTARSTTMLKQTFCLVHQLPEDQPSSLGLICGECKQRLQREEPHGRCLSFWESQPVLNDGDPCGVFTLVWENFQIRSLHPATAWEDLEREAREVLSSASVG